jgi:hypothetical protein
MTDLMDDPQKMSFEKYLQKLSSFCGELSVVLTPILASEEQEGKLLLLSSLQSARGMVSTFQWGR